MSGVLTTAADWAFKKPQEGVAYALTLGGNNEDLAQVRIALTGLDRHAAGYENLNGPGSFRYYDPGMDPTRTTTRIMTDPWTWVGAYGMMAPGAGPSAMNLVDDAVAGRYASMAGSEYSRFLGQGWNPAQAEYLAQPYRGIGHHFPISQAMARNWGLPNWVKDNPLNVLSPNGISRGAFYELHYQVDPNFFAANFPSRIGGTWNGTNLGLQKYGSLGQAWYGSSVPLKVAGGTIIVGGGAAGGYLLLGDGGQQ